MTRSQTSGISCSFKIYVEESIASQKNFDAERRTDLSLHADTFIAARTWIIWYYNGEECQV